MSFVNITSNLTRKFQLDKDYLAIAPLLLLIEIDVKIFEFNKGAYCFEK